MLTVRIDMLHVNPPGHPPREVIAHYLVRGPKASPFDYIQSSRTGELAGWGPDPETTSAAKGFYGTVSFHAGPLGRHLTQTKVDAVLRAPSRFRQACYLLEMALKGGATDISPRMARTGTAYSGEKASMTAVRGGLTYRPAGDEGTFRRLLVVDDTVASATSIGAIVGVLLDAGVPEDCEFLIACYFWAERGGAEPDQLEPQG